MTDDFKTVRDALEEFYTSIQDGDRPFAPTAVLNEALAALSRIEQGREGWKLVPVKPTQKMYLAALSREKGDDLYGGVYKAMIDAAPSPDTDTEQPLHEILDTCTDGRNA